LESDSYSVCELFSQAQSKRKEQQGNPFMYLSFAWFEQETYWIFLASQPDQVKEALHAVPELDRSGHSTSQKCRKGKEFLMELHCMVLAELFSPE